MTIRMQITYWFDAEDEGAGHEAAEHAHDFMRANSPALFPGFQGWTYKAGNINEDHATHTVTRQADGMGQHLSIAWQAPSGDYQANPTSTNGQAARGDTPEAWAKAWDSQGMRPICIHCHGTGWDLMKWPNVELRAVNDEGEA